MRIQNRLDANANQERQRKPKDHQKGQRDRMKDGPNEYLEFSAGLFKIISILFKYKILGFDITMNYIMFMTMFNRFQHLLHHIIS
jgi:hypothetical protein